MSKKDNGRCLICDDVAIGVNFGVLTCMPCKAFFRRNAVKIDIQQSVCRKDDNCMISYRNRRSCNYCRLAKCFRIGMKKSSILCDEERDARNKLVDTNRLKRGKIRKQPCVEWMRPPSLIRMLPSSVHYLSSSDQVILTNIFHAYESTCIVAKKTRFQCFPAVPHTSVHEYLNEMALIFPIFIEYFKHIPEFANIIMDDRTRLVKNHFGIMINVNESLMYPIIPTNLIITWTNVFGIEITKRLLKRDRIMEQYIFDPILLKIVLIVLVLSSNNGRHRDNLDIDQICDDPLSIFAAQNIYVELLWRYILSRSASERDAVKFLDKLMMCILYVKNVDICIDTYINNLTCEVKQMEPLMQSMWLGTDVNENIVDINLTQVVAL